VIVALSALALIAIALTGWWFLLGSARAGMFPRNNIRELTREDGGLGPIARRDREELGP
jgi:hypothetical protein